MNFDQAEMPVSFEDAIAQVNSAPSLRKIKAYLENSNMSADMKAILYDVASFSIKVGQTVIAVGRRIFEISSALIAKFPNLTLSTLVALVVSVVITSTLGAITIGGAAPFAGLAAILGKLVVLIGVAKGFIDDLRANAAKTEMERVAAEFDALGLGVVKL